MSWWILNWLIKILFFFNVFVILGLVKVVFKSGESKNNFLGIFWLLLISDWIKFNVSFLLELFFIIIMLFVLIFLINWL